MLLPPGSRIQDYQISGHLGSGGMGDVYRARDLRLERDVAIKILPHDLAEDPERLLRFEREARALAKLSHANIVQVYDVGQWQSRPFIVMECLEGGTLREALQAGPLGPRKAAALALQIAQGLAAAHEKAIIHRDLKPENIFLVRGSQVRLLDFGLAKPYVPGFDLDQTAALSVPGTPLATQAGVLLGTLGYMAPEQVQGGAIDARTDLFAFGVVLYELVTGARPFQGDSTIETLHAILKLEAPEIPADLKLPPLLERIIRRCLEKDPEDRFQSARDLGFALEHLGNGQSSSANIGDRPAALGKGWRRLGWIALLGCAVLAGGLGSWMIMRSGSSKASASVAITPLPLRITNARYLPDGRGVVFSAISDSGEEELYSVNGQERPRALGIRNARLCSVSPTGEMAVILGNSNNYSYGTLAVVPPGGGGAPREIAKGVAWAEWGPDGHALAIKWFRYQGESFQAVEYPQGHLVHKIPHGHGMGNFSISRKDGCIAFMESIGGTKQQLVVADGSGVHIFTDDVLPGIEAVSDLKWLDGVLYGRSRERDGTVLMAIDYRRRKLKVSERSWFDAELLDVAADGRFLINGPIQPNTVFRWKRASGGPDQMVRWALNPNLNALRADGNALLFSEPYDGSKLWLLKAGEDTPKQLGMGDFRGVFSPDGHWVAVQSPAPGGDHQIQIHPTGPGNSITLPGTWISVSMAFMPDGKSLFLWGALPKGGGKPGAYLQKLAGGPPEPFGDGLALAGPPSPDGEWCFTRKEGQGLPAGLFNMKTKATVPLPDTLPSRFFVLGWTPDGSGFRWIDISMERTLLSTVHLFNRISGQDQVVLDPGPPAGNERVTRVLFSADGRSSVQQITTVARTRLFEIGPKIR